MPEERRPVSIDFGMLDDVTTRQSSRPDPNLTIAAIADAKKVGFVGRSEAVKVDGRSLRKSGRSAQLNIKLKPETKARFLTISANFPNTEEFVSHLLDLVLASNRA